MSIQIVNTRLEHAEALEAHQRQCFPTLPEEDLIKVAHIHRHLELFPEGQHVALDGTRVVGMSSTFLTTEAEGFAPHDFHTIIDGGFFSNHRPHGDWLYGADVSVNAEYRGQGISRMLYNARKALIRQRGWRGMVAGGMLPGYHRYRDQMSVQEYVDAVVAGTLTDPTLTPQLRAGFLVRGILDNYLEAGYLGSQAALIVWENPDLQDL